MKILMSMTGNIKNPMVLKSAVRDHQTDAWDRLAFVL